MLLEEIVLLTEKQSEFKKLQANKVQLTADEKRQAKENGGTWDDGDLAVWKSVDKKSGKVTYVTHTHRAYQTRPTLKGAISIFKSFIKGTA